MGLLTGCIPASEEVIKPQGCCITLDREAMGSNRDIDIVLAIKPVSTTPPAPVIKFYPISEKNSVL